MMKQSQRRFFGNLLSVTCGIVCLGVVSPALGQGAASFQGLGHLGDPDEAFQSVAYEVSGDGLVVVGFSVISDAGDQEAFRWEGGLMESIGTLPGSDISIAYGVSQDGSVVAGLSRGETFRWTDEGMVALGTLPGSGVTYATGVSANDGSVLVGLGFITSSKAFRWTQMEGIVDLGDLPDGGDAANAWAISADGSVIVGFGSSSDGKEAFRWKQIDGIMVGLDDLPGGAFESKAFGVSADGSVVVGFGTSGSGEEAFRWENNFMTGLGDLPGGEFESEAYAVSADGSVVVGYGTVNGNCDTEEAFIWDSVSQMRNLRSVLVNEFGLGSDLKGWTLSVARGISDDGKVIVGEGINPQGNTEAWRAFLPSLPACSGGCDDGDMCTFDQCIGVACTNTPIIYGDLDHDGNVNLADLFCVINGFACTFTTCTFEDVDIAPCDPDTGAAGNGFIDIFDLFAELGAFAGINCCGCGGECPSQEPPTIETINMRLQSEVAGIIPGGSANVLVLADDFVELSGYEVGVQPTGAGGTTGTLTLTEIFMVETRNDFVFSGQSPSSGFDLGGDRMMAALASGSVASTTEKYLATFKFQSSSDASGVFTVSLQASGTQATDATGEPMTIQITGSATIRILQIDPLP